MTSKNDSPNLEPALKRLYGEPLPPFTLHKLPGDASTRAYYRLEVEAVPSSSIVMHLPPDALASDELAAERPTELPFLAVQRFLARRNLPVPRLYIDDVPNRVLLLEDLGDETFAARLSRTPQTEWGTLYQEAIELLGRVHEASKERVPGELPYERVFDEKLLRWELDHFREWGVEAVSGPIPEALRRELDERFDVLAKTLAAAPQGFVHRDYQSRNLMWAKRVEARDATGEAPSELVMIDFQDALWGPEPYDLVALLCDSYVTLSLEFQEQMIRHYCAYRGFSSEWSGGFQRTFWMLAAQRKLKDAGRFVFIDRVRGNAGFLKNYPASLRYVGRALEQLAKDPNASVCEQAHGLRALLEKLVEGFPSDTKIPEARTGQGNTFAT